MKTMLVINSSLHGINGNSHKATQQYVQALQAKGEYEVVQLDLNNEALPHLSGEEMQAWSTTPQSRTTQQALLAAYSDKFIGLVKKADEIVFGLPMYNFGIPSVLKAFLDRIARAGVTFEYTAQGPKGLLENKSTTIIAARGGKYQGSALDTQTPYMQNFLAFIGISDVKFIYLEGLAIGEESANEAWAEFAKAIA